MRINQWATTYLSYNDPRLLIGLGEHNKIDKLEIHWPDGQKESFEPPPIDSYNIIKQGKGISE